MVNTATQRVAIPFLRALILLTLLAAIALLTVLGGGSGPALAVEKVAPAPVFVPGNPTCADLLPGSTELKVESPGTSFSGTAGGASVTGTLNSSQTTITSFTLTAPTGQVFTDVVVFVKGGPGGNQYSFPNVSDDELTSSGLTTPAGEQISHISFCFIAAAPTPTPTPTNTPTPTPTNTPTNTLTPTATNTPTNTPTSTPSNTPTNTPTSTPTATNTPQAATPTPTPFEGCTPGYWKQPQHLDSWAPTGFSPNQTLESVFDVPDSFGLDNVSLLDALSLQGGPGLRGAAEVLLREAVAALLNSAHPDVDYPRSTSAVITAVNAALASGNRATILNLAAALDADNNLGCPLN
ncbi:MAG: hypothetical protein HY332_09440 [Chloroflexi bacterium]|nr:hypothetical protein [Chloroflexota bacterium]